jgi:hypothetical protein
MGKALPRNVISGKSRLAPIRRNEEKSEMQALQEENTRLRELVTELSALVIKGIIGTIEDG